MSCICVSIYHSPSLCWVLKGLTASSESSYKRHCANASEAKAGHCTHAETLRQTSEGRQTSPIGGQAPMVCIFCRASSFTSTKLARSRV
eukprot:5399520-Amphidinium_carterae.1